MLEKNLAEKTVGTTKMVTINQLIAMRILPGRAVRRIFDEQRVPYIEIGNRKYVSLAVFEEYLQSGDQREE